MKPNSPLPFRTFHLLQILRQFEQESLPLDRYLNLYFRTHTALGSKDRKFIAENVYGITRWQLLLDHLSSGHTSPERRFALFQAFEPSHFLAIPSLEPHLKVSFPKELFQQLRDSYGELKAFELCQISNTKAPLCIRINPLKTTREALIKRLEKEFKLFPTKESTLGIQFEENPPLFLIDEFRQGLFEIQDEGSQLISQLLPVSANDHVLDYCAGSGGKSLAFAHKLGKKGTLYLHDIRPHILMEARKRFAKASIPAVQFLSSHHSLLKTLSEKMDLVLADVPCSGTGTLRRNPDQKWRFSLERLQELVKTQRTIFKDALRFVKPGGRIAYATCSLLRAENEEQVDYFLTNYPVELEQPLFHSEVTNNGMDGFFAAFFVKKS